MSESVNAQPIYDFANKDTLAGLLRHFYEKALQNTDDMLPATIVAYDRQTNLATVQPNILIVTTAGQTKKRAPLANVPVFAMGGGGFVVNFPLVNGSTGWIKATDRDISLYMQSAVQSPPNTNRLHSFNDGMFFPDVMKGFSIAGADANNLVIQSLDGTTKISMGIGTLTLAVPGASVAMTQNSIALQSTTLTHNGVDIGAMHKHPVTGVQAGGSTVETGVPNQ